MNQITQNFKSYLSLKPFKWLGSYLWNTRIAIHQSDLNGRLEVWYQGGKPILTSENTTYSYGSFYQVFKRIFFQINLVQKPIQSVLILGFGVGSMAAVLLEDLQMNCSIDAVEHDPEIIHLGQRYFNTKRFHSHLRIFQEDAFSFISQCTEKYDLIMIDLFKDTEVPLKFQSPHFVDRICSLIRPQGMIIFNKITCTGIQMDQFRYLLQKFQEQTGQTRTLSILGKNQIIVWENTKI